MSFSRLTGLLNHPVTDGVKPDLKNPLADGRQGENSRVTPDMLVTILARNVKRFRAKESQESLERRSGVAQATISRLENEVGYATVEIIARLATAFDVQPWELLVDEESTRREALARMLGKR